MKHLAGIVFFFVSIVWGAWWLAVAGAVLLLSLWGDYALVIFGGLLLDLLYGAGTGVFFGVPFLYTVLFSGLSFLAFYLRATMSE